jgi:hypothetical protein
MMLCMLANLLVASLWAAERPSPHGLRHSFHWPDLKIEEASHRIHALERLETPVLFKIQNVSRPVRIGNFVCVHAECLVMGRPQHIQMYTGHALESTILCLDSKGEQAVSYHLRLHPDTHGSVVSLNTTIYKAPRWVHRVSKSVFAFLLLYKDAPCIFNQNLKLYRRMVLGS